MLALVSCFPPAAARAQVRPVYSRGAAGLGHLLQRLQTTASAMHTAAHPDDEDSALISRLARGDHARVTYLSLNRGEGGQNIIGPELFEPLGVIRTEELLQARRLDGGTQMFTRTFDYGFSKSRDEAARQWGERTVLGDMVRAIRRFRPLVIFSRFSGTPADGHGQHQLAGYLTPLAFRLAADPREFPEQIKEGLRPWRARKLYVGQGFRPNPLTDPTLRVPTGILDPLTGRTFLEIAAEGRSQHKSQEMGSIEPRGAAASGLRLVEDFTRAAPATTARMSDPTGGAADNGTNGAANDPTTAATESGMFDRIDTSITGIAGLAGLEAPSIRDHLARIQAAAARALASYDAFAPAKVIPHLAEGLTHTRRARAELASVADTDARLEADFLLNQKEEEFAEALRRAAGVEVDLLADAETIIPGGSALITARVFVPENPPVRLGETRLRVPAGWEARGARAPQEAPQGFRFSRETAARTDYFDLSTLR